MIDPGQARSYGVAVQRFADGSPRRAPGSVGAFREQIAHGLEFSSVFRVIDPKAFLGPETTVSLDDGSPVVCPDWSPIGSDALVEGTMQTDATQFRVEFRVWDTTRCTNAAAQELPASGDGRPIGCSRAASPTTSWRPSSACAASPRTEIAFVSSRGGSSEIYVMNADGTNARAATANRSINTFPSWSASGEVDPVYLVPLRATSRCSSSRRGAAASPAACSRSSADRLPQYRGVFAPLGPKLAVVMSNGDVAEIYTVGSDGRDLTRLTNNRAIDVSPSWSPDAYRIAFVSDRSGSPQVYLMNADGSDQRRITYQGSYNTNPAWSPDGRWIAYESRLEGQFDIWLIDPGGGANVPLISHPRNDEAPTWAPNGRKLAFSSTRRGRADIYVIDLAGGDNPLRLTENAGNNTNPSWGPFPR